jgi:hypothetical protein
MGKKTPITTRIEENTLKSVKKGAIDRDLTVEEAIEAGLQLLLVNWNSAAEDGGIYPYTTLEGATTTPADWAERADAAQFEAGEEDQSGERNYGLVASMLGASPAGLGRAAAPLARNAVSPRREIHPISKEAQAQTPKGRATLR